MNIVFKGGSPPPPAQTGPTPAEIDRDRYDRALEQMMGLGRGSARERRRRGRSSLSRGYGVFIPGGTNS